MQQHQYFIVVYKLILFISTVTLTLSNSRSVLIIKGVCPVCPDYRGACPDYVLIYNGACLDYRGVCPIIKESVLVFVLIIEVPVLIIKESIRGVHSYYRGVCPDYRGICSRTSE